MNSSPNPDSLRFNDLTRELLAMYNEEASAPPLSDNTASPNAHPGTLADAEHFYQGYDVAKRVILGRLAAVLMTHTSPGGVDAGLNRLLGEFED